MSPDRVSKATALRKSNWMVVFRHGRVYRWRRGTIRSGIYSTNFDNRAWETLPLYKWAFYEPDGACWQSVCQLLSAVERHCYCNALPDSSCDFCNCQLRNPKAYDE